MPIFENTTKSAYALHLSHLKKSIKRLKKISERIGYNCKSDLESQKFQNKSAFEDLLLATSFLPACLRYFVDHKFLESDELALLTLEEDLKEHVEKEDYLTVRCHAVKSVNELKTLYKRLRALPFYHYSQQKESLLEDVKDIMLDTLTEAMYVAVPTKPETEKQTSLRTMKHVKLALETTEQFLTLIQSDNKHVIRALISVVESMTQKREKGMDRIAFPAVHAYWMSMQCTMERCQHIIKKELCLAV